MLALYTDIGVGPSIHDRVVDVPRDIVVGIECEASSVGFGEM